MGHEDPVAYCVIYAMTECCPEGEDFITYFAKPGEESVDGTKIDVVLTLNGKEVSFEKMIEQFGKQYEEQFLKEAKKLLEDIPELDTLNEALDDVKFKLRQLASEFEVVVEKRWEKKHAKYNRETREEGVN